MNREIEDLLIEMIKKHCKDNYNDDLIMIDLNLLSETQENILELIKNYGK